MISGGHIDDALKFTGGRHPLLQLPLERVIPHLSTVDEVTWEETERGIHAVHVGDKLSEHRCVH